MTKFLSIRGSVHIRHISIGVNGALGLYLKGVESVSEVHVESWDPAEPDREVLGKVTKPFPITTLMGAIDRIRQAPLGSSVTYTVCVS
jgi:hypothetical protein